MYQFIGEFMALLMMSNTKSRLFSYFAAP